MRRARTADDVRAQEYWTPQQAATCIGVFASNRFAIAFDRGEIAGVKIGKRRLLESASVREWIRRMGVAQDARPITARAAHEAFLRECGQGAGNDV